MGEIMKVAIVTGASSGIGEATAKQLRRLGYRVYAAARRVDRMTHLSQDGIDVKALDVTDDASMTAFVEQVVAEAGRIDVLVNNAGYGSYGAVEDVPLAEARRQFDVNVFGLARLTQLVLPQMRAQRGGRIVNISSIGGKIYEPLGGWYHATKFAVEGLSDSMRVELAPFGIDVVVVEPGAIKTEWGGIAAESALSVSGSTAYRDQAAMVANLLNAAESNPRLVSPPEVVAKAIGRAVTARRPRTRYAVGGGAKPILFLRRALTDRAFDRLIVRMFRTIGGRHARSQPSSKVVTAK
jgi:NAD(P)-dependent dehydrogenase (short-subunit alcohol dehydrogenase family)